MEYPVESVNVRCSIPVSSIMAVAPSSSACALPNPKVYGRRICDGDSCSITYACKGNTARHSPAQSADIHSFFMLFLFIISLLLKT